VSWVNTGSGGYWVEPVAPVVAPRRTTGTTAPHLPAGGSTALSYWGPGTASGTGARNAVMAMFGLTAEGALAPRDKDDLATLQPPHLETPGGLPPGLMVALGRAGLFGGVRSRRPAQFTAAPQPPKPGAYGRRRRRA
jgi:hypothetical protein